MKISDLKTMGIEHPIIQAPMAGGGDTPELVAAVSNAGGLGFIGAAYLTPEQIAQTGLAIRSRTSRPFGINLFAPESASQTAGQSAGGIQRSIQSVAPFYAELGLPAPEPPAPAGSLFPAQLAAALESGAKFFSFTFGIVPAEAIAAIKQRDIFLMGTATTVAEAVALETTGVDAVIAQGAESGGHRGTFVGDFGAGMIGTIALVPQITDAVKIPVIASGGIMDGRGIAAALTLGAVAVQMGTAFLTCHEAGVPEAYKAAILAAREDETRITRAFSGRPARGIVNRFMMEINDDHILPFPLQNALTRPLRTAAGKQGKADYLSLWAGQGLRMARRQPAAELMAKLISETKTAAEHLRTEQA